MNKYTNKLKDMSIDFSYYQFLELLQQIDKDVVDGTLNYFDSECIYYFKQIISMVNDQYIVDNKPGTLGHMLIENTLIKKERLTPTLSMCFFLEQKENLGLGSVCNEIIFNNLNNNCYHMMIAHDHNNGRSNLSINWGYYSKSKLNVDEYNYDVMFAILHELSHVYQLTRTEQTDNLFDKLICYDYQKDSILIKNGGDNGNIFFHQSLLTEFMADEQAYVFMLQLSRNHPEYFNDELIQKNQILYQNRKIGVYGDYGANPREAFNGLISGIRKTYEEYPNEPSVSFIRPMLEEIEILDKKSRPLIEQLQKQRISEKGWDNYYNIYLKSLYKFDGQNIIMNDEMQDKSSKII